MQSELLKLRAIFIRFQSVRNRSNVQTVIETPSQWKRTSTIRNQLGHPTSSAQGPGDGHCCKESTSTDWRLPVAAECSTQHRKVSSAAVGPLTLAYRSFRFLRKSLVVFQNTRIICLTLACWIYVEWLKPKVVDAAQ